MDIGLKLLQSRKEVGMTQEEVAEKLGETRQSISNWENGKTFPDIVSVIKMSDLYNVSLDVLLKDKKEEHTMSKYLNYLDESTNTVKSNESKSKLLIVLTYLIAWSLGMIMFWFFLDPHQGLGFALMYIWLLMPITTLVLSIIIGKNNYWGAYKWGSAMIFGFMYMLTEYGTFSLGNMVAMNRINVPAFELFFVGTVISLFGLGIGTFFYKRKK